MASTVLGQNLTSSLTGNLPKAVLFVRDARNVDSASLMRNANADYGLLNDALHEAVDSALAFGSSVPTLSSLSSLSELNSGSTNYAGFVGMEVQYNPSSIKMNTQAGKQVTNSASSEMADGTISELVQMPVTTMTFQLIFDDMNTSDAFMVNSFSLTGDLITKGSNLVTKAMGGSYSVKTQIDGLLSLLISPVTRQVVFFWSNMVFRGEVTAVSAQYTMFNPKGNPIRGVVELNIRQGSRGDGTGYDYEYEEGYWKQAFQKAFDKDGMAGLTSTFNKATQNNFLNVNI